MATNLSKQWTLASVLGIIKSEIDQLAPDKIQTPQIIDIFHLQLCEVAEMLNGSKYPDYGMALVIAPTSLPAFSSAVNTGTYAASTKTVSKTSHGLAVGQPIVYWDSSGYIAVGSVVSKTDNTFVVSTSLGTVSGTFTYIAFTALAADSVDVSAYGIDTITKINDSAVGLCTPKKFHELDNLSEIPQFSKNIYYAMFGEKVYFFKGSDVTNYGTMTMYYNRLPIKVTVTTDTVDIRDKYVNVVIDKTRAALMGLLKLAVPEQLTTAINSTIAAIRSADASNKNGEM